MICLTVSLLGQRQQKAAYQVHATAIIITFNSNQLHFFPTLLGESLLKAS